ncbi:hypothetical protein C0584_05020 [Candidatus Parcubacteria bacterium]|nr:MAG: hypothetical protein C0584_05020 [Candidatus Parcubacteria bacterium]
MADKKQKNSLYKELNDLFDKLLESRDEKLKGVEELKKKITDKLDKEISELYAKKDFIRDIWSKREHLRKQRVSVLKSILRNSLLTNIRYLVSAPFIYAMFIPTIILHIFLEIYHRICFPLYGIGLVRAREYFVFDRAHLPYLNWLERFNCFYCSYFNCLISYAKEIGGRTERYWCPIKHSKVLKDQHSSYDKFVDYSDGEKLRRKWKEIQKIGE